MLPPNMSSSLGYYGQTSSCFVSTSIRVNISNNLFENNWGIFTDNTILGSQITLNSIVLLGNTTQIHNNRFINTYGIPNEIVALYPYIDSSVSNRLVTPPLISFNYAIVDAGAFDYSPFNQFNEGDDYLLITNCTFANITSSIELMNYKLNRFTDPVLSSNLLTYAGIFRFYGLLDRVYQGADGIVHYGVYLKNISFMNISINNGYLIASSNADRIIIEECEFNQVGVESFGDQFGIINGLMSKNPKLINFSISIINTSFLNGSGIIIGSPQTKRLNVYVYNCTFIDYVNSDILINNYNEESELHFSNCTFQNNNV